MKSFFLSAAFISLLLAISTSHAEQFYKWTDDNGVVHYSQQPPQGKASQPIKTHNSKGQPSAPSNTEAQAQASEEKQPTTTAIKKIKKDPKLCQRAKDDAQTLRQKPIVRRDNKVMTIDEKNNALKNLEEIIKIHC